MTEGKSKIIKALLSEYDIQSVQDIQEALTDLLGGIIKKNDESWDGKSPGIWKIWAFWQRWLAKRLQAKHIKSSIGEVKIELP